MRLPFLPTLILVLVGILLDTYIGCCIRKRIKNVARRTLSLRIHITAGIIMNLGLLLLMTLSAGQGSNSRLLFLSWILFTYLSVYVPKFFFVISDAIASFPRLFKKHRIMIISYIGIAAAILIFIAMWWGALVNRFRIDVREIDVDMPNLPEQFEDYRIVQISDLHVGSYGSSSKYLEKVVEKINSLNPDIIVFTGDLVNRQTSELRPFVSTLSKLHAKDGVYSILGNHDYGDYKQWRTPEQKKENLNLMKSLQKKMGWKLLLDETVHIRRDSSSLALIGVENIGEPPFTVYGSLDRAYPQPRNNSECKILLTHNPAHWVNNVADNTDETIDLTLSGHTHAMQLAVGRWSPARWVYPTWGGMYKDRSGERKLYVNIGLGSVGMPMRIGATPEITVLNLKK